MSRTGAPSGNATANRCRRSSPGRGVSTRRQAIRRRSAGRIRGGPSITVIDNQRDAFEAGGTWGQRLFFNQNGERASLTGQRKSDFLAAARAGDSGQSPISPSDAGREGLNMVLLIQVPLKQKESVPFGGIEATMLFSYCDSIGLGSSDVEEAVIGHGKVEGPFTEIAGLEIERDDRYPVRVTVQFYKATSNGVVSELDMADIAAQINKVYRQADYVGSLVVEGRTGRPTEYVGNHVAPPDWWEKFWQRHLANTGQSREEALAMLRKLLGERWQSASLEQAEQAFVKKGKTAEGGGAP